MKLLQNIFSIKNKDIYKVITVLGIKFKIKSNKLVIKHLKQDVKNLEDYITVQENYAKVLVRLKEKIKTEPLNVIFLSNEPQKWTYASLYKEFEKSEYFRPLVLVYPRERTLSGEDRTLTSTDEHYQLLKNKSINVDYWYKDGYFVDLKSFNPDIIFYTQLAELPDYDSPVKISEYALTFYCPYGFQMADFQKNYTQTFHKLLFKYICEHQLNIERYEKYKKNNSKNCVALGYPKLDVYQEKGQNINISEYWKDPDKFKIIYAPHHTLNDGIYNFGTFLENGKFILELAKKYSDVATWIFKPHPLLKFKLLQDNLLSEAEIDKYYSEWKDIGNYYNGGDYFDIFKSSDLMITDCASFLIEYLPTGKPLLRLRTANSMKLNALGEYFTTQYYNSYNNSELEKLFQELVIKNNDYKKEERQKLVSELIDFKESSAHKICAFLEREFKNYDERDI